MFIKKLKLVISLFVIHNLCVAQTYMGVRIEYLRYVAKTESQAIETPYIFSNDKSEEWDVGIFIPFTFPLKEELNFSLRLGLVLGELYVGPEYSFLAKYNFANETYLVGGLNIHSNIQLGGHSSYGYSETFPFAVLGMGHKLNFFGPIELQFTYPLKNERYGWSRGFTERSSFKNIYYTISWMIKLNLGLEWEL